MNKLPMKQSTFALILSAILVLATGCAGGAGSRSTGETLDDASIATRLSALLLADEVTDGMDIDVEVDRGRVQLNGFIDSSTAIKRAGEIARNTSGVKSVENNLKVSDGTRRTGQYIDDTTLAARIKTALIKDPEVNAAQVDIEVNNGRVSLGGFVDTRAARNAAERIARDVYGVKEVNNNLTVR